MSENDKPRTPICVNHEVGENLCLPRGCETSNQRVLVQNSLDHAACRTAHIVECPQIDARQTHTWQLFQPHMGHVTNCGVEFAQLGNVFGLAQAECPGDELRMEFPAKAQCSEFNPKVRDVGIRFRDLVVAQQRSQVDSTGLAFLHVGEHDHVRRCDRSQERFRRSCMDLVVQNTAIEVLRHDRAMTHGIDLSDWRWPAWMRRTTSRSRALPQALPRRRCAAGCRSRQSSDRTAI